MKISHVRIQNILGIEQFEFDAGQFNVLSGKNGQGKTSVLEAIKAALKGGNDATLLRKGADAGEVVLVLEDGYEIRKRVTPRTATTTVLQDGKSQPRPVEFLSRIADMMSVNPVDFLLAPKKERVRVLLESMPLALDVERLKSMAGQDVTVPEGMHPLYVIEAVRKQVFDQRTDLNRSEKEKASTISQLREAMPDAPAVQVAGSEDELVAQKDAIEEHARSELERIDAKMSGIKSRNVEKIDAIRAKLQADIDALKAAASAEVDAIKAEEERVSGLAEKQRGITMQERTDKLMPLNEQLAVLRANRGALAKREQAEALIASIRAEREALARQAEDKTKAIEAIDAYKLELLSALPVPGLEVVDGELFRAGVPFDRLNTAQRVEIAVEIAKLRSGSLKVCCVDGIECLDADTLAALREGTLAAGLQLFVSKVADQPFGLAAE